MSKLKCAQLLVWLYVFGGGQEATVVNDKLRSHILYAQDRFNIYGSQVPDLEGVVLIKRYLKDLDDYMNPAKCRSELIPPDWLEDIMKEYGVKL